MEIALDSAGMACEEARKTGLVPYVASWCGLLARLMFIKGDRDNAIKGFRENWNEASSEVFLGMSTEGIVGVLADYLVSLMASNDLGRAKEEYEKHGVLLYDVPLFWAFAAGLMRVYGINVEKDFSEARRQAIMMNASTPFREVLRCPELEETCENECWEIQDIDARTLCLELIETRNNPRLMKGVIKDFAREWVKWYLEQLLDGVNDTREIIEVAASLTRTDLSLVEVFRFITEGRFNKAWTIAERWHDSLWDRLAKSLGEGACNEDCREVLLKLFYFHV